MPGFKIKNGKLALLALLFFCIFTGLGCWQLSRATYKKALLKSFAERTLATPLLAKELNLARDARFYRAELHGSFDNQHAFFLDNKTLHGKVGYEVYLPFNAVGLSYPILVDLGFIAMNANRATLPTLPPIPANTTIIGMINQPPTYVAFGPISETTKATWPLRIEFVDLPQIAKQLNYPLFPFILVLDPKNPHALHIEWQIVMMGPEKHSAYALQWFALALTLLILFVVLNRA